MVQPTDDLKKCEYHLCKKSLRRLYTCKYCKRQFCKTHAKQGKVGGGIKNISKEWHKEAHPCLPYSDYIQIKEKQERKEYGEKLNRILSPEKYPPRTIKSESYKELLAVKKKPRKNLPDYLIQAPKAIKEKLTGKPEVKESEPKLKKKRKWFNFNPKKVLILLGILLVVAFAVDQSIDRECKVGMNQEECSDYLDGVFGSLTNLNISLPEISLPNITNEVFSNIPDLPLTCEEKALELFPDHILMYGEGTYTEKRFSIFEGWTDEIRPFGFENTWTVLPGQRWKDGTPFGRATNVHYKVGSEIGENINYHYPTEEFTAKIYPITYTKPRLSEEGVVQESSFFSITPILIAGEYTEEVYPKGLGEYKVREFEIVSPGFTECMYL